jgi:hypothetical protein
VPRALLLSLACGPTSATCAAMSTTGLLLTAREDAVAIQRIIQDARARSMGSMFLVFGIVLRAIRIACHARAKVTSRAQPHYTSCTWHYWNMTSTLSAMDARRRLYAFAGVDPDELMSPAVQPFCAGECAAAG